MTLGELREALDGLPQLENNTPVCVEDQRGELHDLVLLDYEASSDPEYRVVVLKFDKEVAEI